MTHAWSKHIWIFETLVLDNNNFCEKLVSSLALPTTFDERFS